MNRDALLTMAQREQQRQQALRGRILCCASTPCLAGGSAETRVALERAVEECGLAREVEVVPTGCNGLCSRGPMARVQMRDGEDVLYQHVTSDVARLIVGDRLGEDGSAAAHVVPRDLPFFARQTNVVLSDAGLMDQERLEEYVARGGYSALARALHDMTPDEVCSEIAASGLRGHGGAGYPTGQKWQLLHAAPGPTKFVVANGDEGDPGAYMDRTLMEADPHRVIEGLAIAGYATGAAHGYLYVRGEYPMAVKRLEQAIHTAERNRILGDRVLDTDFSFKAEIRIGAGAYVCGEETALMASIEGRRGMPHMRPPYPTEHGLWGFPTMINNVETLGNIPPIIAHGAPWFAGIGTERSKGTKVFALTGRLRDTGLVEVPMGITLREIVEEIGGGVPDGRAFKAAQTGGPSGGCIPAKHLDTPVDYESLKALGSIMGSGGLIVMDDRSCMPDVAKYFMDFSRDESCGKCAPCRIGTVKLYRLLERITNGQGTMDDLDRLEQLCGTVRTASLCGLGQGAPSPVLSTLRYFRDEYVAHVRERRCPAGVCNLEPSVISTASRRQTADDYDHHRR